MTLYQTNLIIIRLLFWSRADQASEAELVDEVAADKEEAVQKCRQHLLQFKACVPSAVAETKLRY